MKTGKTGDFGLTVQNNPDGLGLGSILSGSPRIREGMNCINGSSYGPSLLHPPLWHLDYTVIGAV